MLELYKARRDGDTERELNILDQNIDLLNDPKYTGQFLQLLDRANNVPETDEMRRNDFAMEERWMNGGGTPELAGQLAREMYTAPPGKYTKGGIATMMKRWMNGESGESYLKPAREDFNTALSYNSEAMNVGFAEFYPYVQQMDGKGNPIPALTRDGKQTQEGLAQEAFFKQEVRDRYYEKWQKRDPAKWDKDKLCLSQFRKLSTKLVHLLAT